MTFLSNVLDKLAAPLEERRDYIGASLIGSDCWRQIWYEWIEQEADPFPPKTLRNFEVGKTLEAMILDFYKRADLELRFYGIEGIELKPDWPTLEDPMFPYFKGNIDAMWMKNGNPYAIVEIKTANDANFNSFVRKGLKNWSERYYAQLQAYMGMSGIHKSYLVCLNKNTSEIHDQEILYVDSYYKHLRIKANIVHDATEPPPKISSNPMFYVCKMCKFNKECHK